MKVNSYLYLTFHAHRCQIDDANSVVVIRHVITATVGDIEFATIDSHLLGLIAHNDGIDLLQCQRIDFIHHATRRVAAHSHRTHIGADVGIATIERHIAAVGNVYLAYLDSIRSTTYLDLVRAVDDQPQARTVNLDIVANIA